jgi:hypothetical protein
VQLVPLPRKREGPERPGGCGNRCRTACSRVVASLR